MTVIIELINSRTSFSLGNQIQIASSFAQRAIGLLGRSSLKIGEGLLIERCNQVHMYFMKFAIDVVFLSPELEILDFEYNLKPWKLSKRVYGAYQVLELPSSMLESCGCLIGDKLVIK